MKASEAREIYYARKKESDEDANERFYNYLMSEITKAVKKNDRSIDIHIYADKENYNVIHKLRHEDGYTVKTQTSENFDNITTSVYYNISW